MACLKYGEPRFEVFSSVDFLLPDWFSEGSIPAKAVSLLGELKLLISPISAKITGAIVLPTPGILSRWLSSLE